jgi:formate dehydrogenase iron-sulfur subunit
MHTWNALSKIPGVVTVGGVLLYGIWWITNRRTEVRAYEEKLEEMERRSDGAGKAHKSPESIGP